MTVKDGWRRLHKTQKEKRDRQTREKGFLKVLKGVLKYQSSLPSPSVMREGGKSMDGWEAD